MASRAILRTRILDVKEGGVRRLAEELSVERAVAVKVGRQLKLSSFLLGGNCGLGLLGLRGWEAREGFWPHQQCPLWVMEPLLNSWGMPAQLRCF